MQISHNKSLPNYQLRKISPEGKLRFLTKVVEIPELKHSRTEETTRETVLLYDSELTEKDTQAIIFYMSLGSLAENDLRFHFEDDKWFVLRGEIIDKEAEGKYLTENQINATL